MLTRPVDTERADDVKPRFGADWFRAVVRAATRDRALVSERVWVRP
ncbi:MAG: hypothetical protein ACR2GH_08315 [Pseudonocardia sp.]